VSAPTTAAATRAGKIEQGGGLAKGQRAPEIVGKDVDGKQFRLSDYHGKVVLLDFWATW
jgi:hypothetical protein